MVNALFSKIVQGSNVILLILSLVVLGLSANRIYNYDEEGEVVDRSVYAGLVAASTLSVIAACFAIAGVRNPRDNAGLLFMYFFFLTFLLVTLSASVYIVGEFEDALEISLENETEDLSAADRYFAKRSQDFVVSAYQSCCVNSFENCGGNNTCAPVVQCDTSLFNEGLGTGCLFEGSATNLPFEFSESFCNTSTDYADFLGPQSEGRCGGGDPQAFQNDVFDELDSTLTTYFGIGVTICLFLAINWVGTFYLNACPNMQREGGAQDKYLTI